jgi:hypothetical protein
MITTATTERTWPFHASFSTEEYHEEAEHDSNSTLSLFRNSPKAYHRQRVAKIVAPKPSSDVQRLGNVLPTGILEPHRFDELIVAIPRDVLTSDGRRAGNAWKAFLAENPGRFPVKMSEADIIHWQIDAVWDEPAAAELLSKATAFEQSIFWRHDDGHLLKARFDAALELDAISIDLKRSESPNPKKFGKAIMDYGYHCQAALYADGFEALYGTRPASYFIVVGSQEPYEAFVYELEKSANQALAAGGIRKGTQD